jgi:hypothetical protein
LTGIEQAASPSSQNLDKDWIITSQDLPSVKASVQWIATLESSFSSKTALSLLLPLLTGPGLDASKGLWLALGLFLFQGVNA